MLLFPVWVAVLLGLLLGFLPLLGTEPMGGSRTTADPKQASSCDSNCSQLTLKLEFSSKVVEDGKILICFCILCFTFLESCRYYHWWIFFLFSFFLRCKKVFKHFLFLKIWFSLGCHRILGGMCKHVPLRRKCTHWNGDAFVCTSIRVSGF